MPSDDIMSGEEAQRRSWHVVELPDVPWFEPLTCEPQDENSRAPLEMSDAA